MNLIKDILKLWIGVLVLQITVPLTAVLLTFVIIADYFSRKVIRKPYEFV